MPDGHLSQFTTVFRADNAHRVKRNRLAVSCTSCQRRKSKCDRQHPCGACEKRGEQESCYFEKQAAGAGGSGGRKELQLRLSKLEQMVKGLADRSPETGENSGSGAGGSVSGSSGSQDGSKPRRKQDDGRRPRDHVVLRGQQYLEGSESTYHGATSWAALMSSIRDIQSLLDAEPDDDGDFNFGDPAEVTDDHDPLFGGLDAITIDEVMSNLPSRTDSDRLVTAFFNAKFISVPYLHTHYFRRCYEAFWQNPYSTSFLWISILFSVLALGAHISKTQNLDLAQLPTVVDFQFYIVNSARCLMAGQYLRAKPFSVEAVVIHAHCRNVHKKTSDSSLWALYGLAVRLAQKRGFHRDPSKISLRLSPFEAEMRRRVWFLVQSSDVLHSFHHGMPSMIDEDLCDAEHPTNLTDDDFDEHTVELPPPRPETDPIPILVYTQKSKLGRTVRRVIRHCLSTKSPPYSQTLALTDDLHKWYADLPACLRTRPIEETAFADPNYTIMHRLMLEMMYRKTMCVLHRPYLSLYKSNSKYDQSRQICRESAVKLLELHCDLDRAFSPGGRMYPDRFMMASITFHHFLLAAMVLSLDLSEATDYDLQGRADHISLLHTIYEIWTRRSNENTEARHASQVLRAVLQKITSTPIGSSPEDPTPTTDMSGLSITSSSMAIDSLGAPSQPQVSTFVDPIASAINNQMPATLDNFFGGDNDNLDWHAIDQYIRFEHVPPETWQSFGNSGSGFMDPTDPLADASTMTTGNTNTNNSDTSNMGREQ